MLMQRPRFLSRNLRMEQALKSYQQAWVIGGPEQVKNTKDQMVDHLGKRGSEMAEYKQRIERGEFYNRLANFTLNELKTII